MRRREFIAGLGGAAAWPLAARAQQAAVPVVGYLGDGTLATRGERVAALLLGLADTGYIEGQNVVVEYVWAEDRLDRLPTLAAELVRRRVAVIATPSGTAPALAAKAATQTIPVIFLVGTDPVEIGLVASLAHPGGNVTGITALTAEVIGKRLEILHELAPAAASTALLVNSTNPVLAEAETKEAQRAARVLGVRLLVLTASSLGEIETAFATMVQQRAGSVLVGGDTLFTAARDLMTSLAARHNMPAMYQFRESAMAGGLMSYGPNLSDAVRQVGVYAGRILNGEKPADLPVHQSTKFELTINLKAAQALGLTIPETLLATADEVIQ